MALLDVIKTLGKATLNIILPSQIEKKYGIDRGLDLGIETPTTTRTSTPAVTAEKPMEFPAIPGAISQAVQDIQAPGAHIKLPFVQKEVTVPSGGVEETAKSIIEAPEKITKTLTEELPFKIQQAVSGEFTDEVPTPKPGELFRVEGFGEQAREMRNDLLDAGYSPTVAVAAAVMQTGGEAILDTVFIGNVLQEGTKFLGQALSPKIKQVASWELMGHPKSIAELQSNYRKLAHQFHPDKIGDDLFMKQINKANNHLKKTGIPSAVEIGEAQVSQAALRATGKLSDIGKPVGEVTKLPFEQLPGVKIQSKGPKFGLSIEERVSIPNMKRITAGKDVKNLIEDTAKQYAGKFNEATRGVIKHETTQEVAEALGMTASKLLKRKKGKAMNAEEITAARNLMVSSASYTNDLAKVANATGNKKDLATFIEAFQRHAAIQEQVTGATAEAGRALSAMRIEGQAKNYEAIIKSMGGREPTEELAQRLAQIDPNNFLEVNRFVKEAYKATTKDKIFEYWVNAILSHPTTHTVNNTSNLLVRMAKVPARVAGASIDVLRSSFTGTPRQRFFGEAVADVIGMSKGIAEGTRRALFVYQNGMPPLAETKLDVTTQKAIKGKKGEVIRFPGTSLVAEDEFFKAMNSQAELHAEAYRKAVKEGLKGEERAQRMGELLVDPTPEMLSAAKAEELYRTFQKPLGKGGQYLIKMRNASWPLKFILPFLRTPINIAKFGLEMTPLNFLRLGMQKAQGKFKGKPGEFIDEIVKPVMGSAIAGTIAFYAADDKVTGHAPTDREKRDAFYREGKQPYSIRIGDKWFSYTRLEPIGTVIGMTADFVQDYDIAKKEERDEIIRAITASINQNLVNKTYLSGLSAVMNAVEDPVRYGSDWVENFTAGFIPQALKVPTETIDPYFRRPASVIDAWKKKVPWLSQEVPPIRNVWGEKAEREGGLGGVLTPVRTTTAREDPVDQEIKRIDYEMGFPAKDPRGFKLDAWHYDMYHAMTGSKIKQALDRLIQNPDYKRSPDSIKKKAIKNIVEVIRDRWKKEMLFNVFVDQMDIDIPTDLIDEQKAAMIFYSMLEDEPFRAAPNDKKREFYTRNLQKFLTR